MKLVAFAFAFVALSSPAFAEDPVIHVTAAKVKNCNTDGGGVSCSVGTQTLAKGLQLNLDQLALACPGTAKKKATITLTYEYNDGSVFYRSHIAAQKEHNPDRVTSTPLKDEKTLVDNHDGKPLKKLPGLPACVNEKLIPKASELILSYLDKLHEIDPEVDVRADYELKLEIE